MLYLLFKIGDDRYALEAGRVVEVVPLVNLQRLAASPPGVAGVFNYRGQIVPAIDLSELLLHQPAADRLSTRIILVKYSAVGTDPRLLGLIAEEATETLRKEPSDFGSPAPGALGRTTRLPALFDAQGAIHLLDESCLLSESLRNQLAHVTD